MKELSRQQSGTIQYLVNEYRTDMRSALDKYLTIPPPTRPMVHAMEEVIEEHKANCAKLGIAWSEIQAVLDKDIGYSTGNVTRLKDRWEEADA